MGDRITENRNGSPKFIGLTKHGDRRWAHQWRSDIGRVLKFRNRFRRHMSRLREYGPSTRWQPRGCPFMDSHIAPRYGRLRNLRYWRW